MMSVAALAQMPAQDMAAANMLAQAAAPMPSQAMPAQGAAPTNLAATLAELDQVARQASVDIASLRIDKWKTNGDGKQAAQQTADSLQRNMTSALPGILAQVRTRPNDSQAMFKLYRNVGALYDVLASLAQEAGAFGAKEEYEVLAQHTARLDSARLSLASAFEQLLAAKEAALARVQPGGSAAATGTAAKPRRIIVDDTVPAKKKTTPKKKPS
jgi:hypothetical protein